MMAAKQKEFKVLEVPLVGTNLVEASAGTGKTYSIAIIALRLIIEKDISISEILMVTYTKAAVAELEQRIRIFIKKAAAVVEEEVIDDQTIISYINSAISEQGREVVKRKLDAARLFIDETSILTIHSFCQQVLQEYSFETGALFGMNLVTSISDIITQEVQIFWRKHVSGLPIAIFPFIKKVTIETLADTVAMQLGGRQYSGFHPEKNYVVDENILAEMEAETKALQEEIDFLEQQQIVILSNDNDIADRVQSNSYARKAMTELVGDPDALLSAILYKPETGYKQKLFPDVLELQNQINTAEEAISRLSKSLQHSLTCMALQHVIPAVRSSKRKLNVVGFDDLIAEVHKALVLEKNQALVNLLQAKYKAVFVDEFQDTDLKQYEIFKTAFASASIMFYIGDPKQSIYKFRSADIFTYLQAKKEVDVIYTMNTNYRSSHQYIKAANRFLKPNTEFDTFHFKDDEDGIDYINVEASADKNLQVLNGSDPLPAIVVASVANKSENLSAVVSCAAMLLNGNHFLTTNDQPRLVVPSDIGILVKSNKTARAISLALSARDIPSVLVSDAKIFGSPEVAFLFNVLHAMLEPGFNSINKALLGNYTGITEQDIHQLNHEKLLPLFAQLNDKWATQGVYSAIKEFLLKFNVESRLIEAQSTIADRSITNLQQVTELLYKAERINNLQPKELVQWLQRMLEEDGEGDEYLQRIESEEDAVKISTVHKSKGLEYNIVIAPNLDYTLHIHRDFVQYKDAATGLYVSKHKDWLSPEELLLYQTETEQEHRRLLYVALTRAVYCSIILKSTSSYFNYSSLSSFLNVIKDDTALKIDPSYFANAEKYQPQLEQKKFVLNPLSLRLSENSWYKLSYSSLSAEVPLLPRKRRETTTAAYDNFIFSSLTAGAETGNLVHQLFENISFNNEEYWTDAIAKVVMTNRAKDEALIPQYVALAANVLNAKISTGNESFKLSDIIYQNKIHELEFYFPLTNFSAEDLSAFFSEKGMVTYIKSMSTVKGMMQGFVDLLFLHDGKYYILDWKTTFLGSNISDYNSVSVTEAMAEHNYHLQYMIYCVAVTKYLISRKADFDYDTEFGGVIYGFVRGMRNDLESGVFFNKPDREIVFGLAEMLSH